jgi:hypothetical protein
MLDGGGTFAGGGGDAFDGSVAGVAGGENARLAGFEQEWLALKRPRGEVVPVEVSSGEDVAGVVPGDGALQPAGVGGGADHDEERGGFEGVDRAGVGVLDGDVVEWRWFLGRR